MIADYPGFVNKFSEKEVYILQRQFGINVYLSTRAIKNAKYELLPATDK